MRWAPYPPRVAMTARTSGSVHAAANAAARPSSESANHGKVGARAADGAATFSPHDSSRSIPAASRSGSTGPDGPVIATRSPGASPSGRIRDLPGARGPSISVLRRRRPARRSRAISSREETGVAPASTTRSYHSAGTS